MAERRGERKVEVLQPVQDVICDMCNGVVTSSAPTDPLNGGGRFGMVLARPSGSGIFYIYGPGSDAGVIPFRAQHMDLCPGCAGVHMAQERVKK